MSYKMALIVRNDLNMSKGKIAAQVAHATVDSTINAFSNTTHFYKWRDSGETIIAVKANLTTLNTVLSIAEKKGVICGKTIDAGRTEVPEGSITVAYVGPDKCCKIDKLIGQLKLL